MILEFHAFPGHGIVLLLEFRFTLFNFFHDGPNDFHILCKGQQLAARVCVARTARRRRCTSTTRAVETSLSYFGLSTRVLKYNEYLFDCIIDKLRTVMESDAFDENRATVGRRRRVLCSATLLVRTTAVMTLRNIVRLVILCF